MKNVHLLTGKVSDECTLSGGSWNADYPLTNLQTTQPGDVARTADTAAASTRFILDAGASRSWQMFAFCNHNLSTGATIRIRVSDSSGGSPDGVLDETITIDNSTVVWGALPWGAFPWSGIDEDFPGGFTAIYLHDSAVAGRYLIVDIDDPNNVDGYAEIGRFLADVPFVPAENAERGSFSIGVGDPSIIERTRRRRVIAEAKPKFRRMNCRLRFLTQAEALEEVHEILHQIGVAKGVLVVVNPEDAAGKLMRRTLYGTFKGLGSISFTEVAAYPHSWDFAVDELVAEAEA